MLTAGELGFIVSASIDIASIMGSDGFNSRTGWIYILIVFSGDGSNGT